MTRRLLLDISSLARWSGPPVGIARVANALARAGQGRPGTELVFWDRPRLMFRRLAPAWAETVLGWHGAIDIQDPSQSLLSRHRLIAALERVRLTRPRLAPVAERLQDAMLSLRRHGHRVRDADGARIALVPPDMALAEPIALSPGDVLLSAGSDWFDLDVAALAAAKSRLGFRYARLCYDLIPITHPQFFPRQETERFTCHWRAVLPIADLVIVNATCIGRDVAHFCAAEAIPPPTVAVLPLGYDPPPPAVGTLPWPLEPDRYALLVSTIEPRKGHAMLLRVWRRLLARRVPQEHDFRLVFVGRPGWMVDDLLSDLAAGIERVHYLDAVDDKLLAALYAQAAFAVYPSAYEGFGLPVIEALAGGKPVLASTGGALPETVGGAFPCLPPDDEAAWLATLAAWIVRRPPVAAMQTFVDWSTAATNLLAQAERA